MNLLKRFKSEVDRLVLHRPYFATRDVVVGRNVSFGKNIVFNCNRVRIGDGVVFQDNIRINAEVFEVGDYGTFYPNFFVPGPGELRMGHNCHIGISTTIDAMGGTRIGNNVGIGAYSQLWT